LDSLPVSHTKHVALVLEYNGSHFCGWQEQPGLRTIQAELKKAIQMVTRSPIRGLVASGRTDSGVHALGQVVAFYTDAEISLPEFAYSVSGVLRDEVAIVKAALVPDNFHPRKSALKKRYEYHILYRPNPPVLDAGRAWHVRGPLDIKLMQDEAAVLVGLSDFRSMQGKGCAARTTERTIFKSELIWNPPHLTYVVEGEGFLKQMVRNIVGTLVGRGRGVLTSPVSEILAARDRRKAGVTAPGHGLTLVWVEYEPEFMELLKI